MQYETQVNGVGDAAACRSISASNVWQTAVNNCGSLGAPVYFILFQILGVFVLLNLMVAVITETFSLSKNAGTEVEPLLSPRRNPVHTRGHVFLWSPQKLTLILAPFQCVLEAKSSCTLRFVNIPHSYCILPQLREHLRHRNVVQQILPL